MILAFGIDYEGLLNRFGWPTLGLFAVVGCAVYISKKVLIPFFEGYIKSIRDEAVQARKSAEDASSRVQDMLTNQLAKTERSKERLEHMEDDVFTSLKEALQNSVLRQDKQIEMMSEILSTVKRSDETRMRRGSEKR